MQGLGTKGMDYPAYANGKDLKEHKLWTGMLERCTAKCWTNHPTYIGTTCSENFKSYSFFYEWCQEQAGFKSTDESNKVWHLDKDLLFKGNKHYSEDTCVFVPLRINALLIKSDASRGDFPLGVSWHNSTKKFMARCHDGSGKSKYLGYFLTKESAFQAYKVFKEALIKEVANEYRTQLDPRAYQALLNYTVEITD